MSVFLLYFIAILGASATAVIVRISRQRKHLSDNELRSFHRLNPRNSNYSRIIGHIGQCEQCRIRMDDLQHEIDHLIED